MGWFTTGAVTEFLAEAGEFLRAEPARNSVILSVTENLRLRAAARPNSAAVDERLGYGGLSVWEADGVPVSVAGITRAVVGMVRVGPVYTPPALRSRGYAGGATAAVSQAALDAGATQVVLYTDLANPTSNALYERLGYRPVEDRVVLAFEPRHPAAR
jgi:predicted GNAT family acetyltransferase